MWVIYVFAVVYAGIVALSFAGIYHLRRAMVLSLVTEEETDGLVSAASSVIASRRCLFRGIAAFWILLVIAIGIIFAMVSLFWPSPPQISMCNAELMWSDTLNMIINSVTTGKTTVESEVLISVYNPNRIGAQINSINGNVYYKGSPVGTIELSPIDGQAGSVSDGLGVLSFDGFEHITEMFYDFNVAHELLLEFEIFINFTVGPMNALNVAAPRFQMNVNNPPPQEHCKCKDVHKPVLSLAELEYI
jgi:hypothetical protein